MNGKLVACLVGLALLVGLVLVFVGGDDARRPHESRPVAAAEPEAPVREDTLTAAGAPATPAPEIAREELREAPAIAAPTTPWRGVLAGVIGRVVEVDGTPVPGMRVALLQFDSTILFDGSALDEGPGSLVLEDAVTDRDGRFVLGGARGPAFHGLGLDLNGPRATLRVIDQALPHGERTDLGDIVLAPYAVLAGRVVDDAGAPVPGARVRAAPFPEEVLMGEPWEFREQSLVAVSLLMGEDDSQGIIEPPPWVREAIERFPLPTTTSGEDGTFRLEGVAQAKVIGGIDKSGWVGAPIGPLDLSGGGEHDLGDVVLTRGRTIEGFVEDLSGDPVVGIEVFAGAEVAPGTAAILQPCGATDADGRFSLTGVRAEGQIIAAARRSPHERWSVTSTGRIENVLIELEDLVQLTVHVLDEAGAPLEGARLALKPAFTPKGGFGMGQALAFLPRPSSPRETFREGEPGTYVAAALTLGDYDLTVRAPGRVPQQRTVQCVAETNEITITCMPGRTLEVTVIDALSREPVTDARLTALRMSTAGFTKLAVERTDSQGQARLGPLPRFEAAAARGPFPSATTLVINHPQYSDHTTSIPDGTPSLTIELGAGGTLAGRVHWGGAIPTRLYMVSLEARNRENAEELFHLPRLATTDLEGSFRIPMLPAGTYRLELIERFLNRDPFGLMAEEFDPVSLHSEEVEIVDGQTTEVVIDLTPTGRGPTARLRGRVRVDGRPIRGAKVRVRSAETQNLVTDAGGRFETVDFAVREEVSVTVTGDPSGESEEDDERQLYYKELELKDGELRDLDIDLYTINVPVQALDEASGDPLADATFRANLAEGNVRYNRNATVTGQSGKTELALLQAGSYEISAKAPGHSETKVQVEIPPEGPSEPVVLRLPRSVPCSGHVRVLDPTLAEGPGFSYLWVQREGVSSGTRLEAPDFAFELENLSPGTYKVWIYVNGQQGEQQEIQLGEAGDTSVELDFVPAAGR